MHESTSKGQVSIKLKLVPTLISKFPYTLENDTSTSVCYKMAMAAMKFFLMLESHWTVTKQREGCLFQCTEYCGLYGWI